MDWPLDLQPLRRPRTRAREGGDLIERTVKTVCPYCGVGCGLSVKVRDERIVDVRGDKDHPSNRGAICPKGAQLDEIIRAPNRLTSAHCRVDRSQPFAPVALDDALNRVAD